MMDLEKHLREKERLNQALGKKFPLVQTEIEALLIKYGLDATPGLAHDISCLVIEELYLKRFNLSEY